jgi:hypothetical protein
VIHLLQNYILARFLGYKLDIVDENVDEDVDEDEECNLPLIPVTDRFLLLLCFDYVDRIILCLLGKLSRLAH